MDEPCDWDVCTEAAVPVPLSRLSSRTEKKRCAKAITDQAPNHSGERKPEKTHPAPRQGAHGEENHRKVSPAEDAPLQSPPQTVPTRKELQDALPKISPLSSFKSCRSRFVTFEEAEQDFHSFITTGLGRSVDVIREFRGQEDGVENGHSESVTLYDDAAQKLHGKRWKSDLSHPRSMSGSSSSQSDKDDGECRAITKSQTEARQTPAVTKPKVESTKSIACTTSAPQIYPQTTCASNGRALSQPDDHRSAPVVKSSRRPNQAAPAHESRKIKEGIGKRSKKVSGKANRGEEGRECDEGEHDDEEEEWSAETYWRASYRAWNDYYASMSPFQEQGYQSYYSAAHNWMAAYRMNAVYMEELLKY